MPYTENNQARILIVDDHPIVRQGIALLINREPELKACCEANNSEQALSANFACKHQLAIVDLSLAGLSGLELVKQMRGKFPEMAILMISMHDETIYAERALRAGANGYLMKQEATTTILQAIRLILRGEFYISDRMRTRILQQSLHGPAASSPIAALTSTEFEVFNLIGTGMGTSEIANKLNRSVKTIESHRANIKKKLSLNTSNELALFAFNWQNKSELGPSDIA
ncbi:MAG: response regulator transcription factor [Sterolibacterium sp.]